MPVYFVKGLHFHLAEEHTTTEQATPHSHHPGNCPICHFTLSPFVEMVQQPNVIIRSFIFIEPASTLCKADLHQPYISYRRAPPVA